ncbi:MAG TPA: hypothetical protein PKA64_22460 [Myxococcota bacterium]|nr:hypothetical protein [Myxococcota bacterium]
MRALLITSSLVVACAPGAPEALPGDALTPPASMTLTAPDRLFTGEHNTFTVTGNLGQQELVYLVLGRNGTGGGPCLPALGGQCLDVASPHLVAQASYDGTEASLDVVLPPSMVSGDEASFQAAVIRGRRGSVSVVSGSLSLTVEDYVLGCTDPAGDNYDPAATVEDGSCQVGGCTNPVGDNYDPVATYDDGTCEIGGCTDPAASNYDPAATYDNGSCVAATGNPPGSLLVPTSAWTDPSPPVGWTQCGGFINTSADDVTTHVLDNCLNTTRLRMRIWNAAMTLVVDVATTNQSSWSAWPDFSYLGGSPLTQLVNTEYTGTTAFFTDQGGDACSFSGYNTGFSIGNGNGSSINVSPADNDPSKEIRINCNGAAKLNYRVSFYR